MIDTIENKAQLLHSRGSCKIPSLVFQDPEYPSILLYFF
jgi:hypothetical protein